MVFLGSVKDSKTILESTHVVEQHLFFMFSSNQTFDFDLIWGHLLTFLGFDGVYLVSGLGSKTVLGSTRVVEQL